MGRSTCFYAKVAVFLSGFLGSTASAQTLRPPLVNASHVVLPPMPHLELSWPVAPLAFSFSATDQPTGYAGGPLQLYTSESLWLAAPSLQLVTVGSSERAFELDCRLTCQPVVKRTFDLEARVLLPLTTRAVPSSYVFLRSSSFKTSQNPRSSQPLGGGFAGTLNF
jgi:hypothetical protein